MSPHRSTTIGGRIIHEYYWAGDWVVYVDHALATVGYDEAVRLATEGEPVPLARDRQEVAA